MFYASLRLDMQLVPHSQKMFSERVYKLFIEWARMIGGGDLFSRPILFDGKVLHFYHSLRLQPLTELKDKHKLGYVDEHVCDWPV